VLGGATGKIGDPSGRSSQRPFLDFSEIESNILSIQKQLNSIAAQSHLDTSGLHIVNNADWITQLSCLDFFRQIGRHFRVSSMLGKDSVKQRLSDDGLSFLEFSYMCFQAYDFAYLYENHAVNLQIGGQDQWGNMAAGLDLIEKREKAQNFLQRSKAHLLTVPLLTTTRGEKFGKSVGNAVWLSSALSSPYDLYQYFLRAPDSLVAKYLHLFTFSSQDDIDSLLKRHHVITPCYKCFNLDFIRWICPSSLPKNFLLKL
jgi:tyrosyl-tRNA synthetase